MQKSVLVFILFFFTTWMAYSQPVEVRFDYNAVGDVEFSAYNNTKAPLFVHIILGDLQNTYYHQETLPIVKIVEPGYNSLFNLEHDISAAGGIRFHHEIKIFRSNPVSEVNLDFPYLIPLKSGKLGKSVLVKDIDGFMGLQALKSWIATGFEAQPGEEVFAARNGIIVEISGAHREEGALIKYNGWNNTITVLQPDGTLASYCNVSDSESQWKVGDRVYSGQYLGQIAPGADELIFLVFYENLDSKDFNFIFPRFFISEDHTDIILSDTEFTVLHPEYIRGLEMDKREKRKFLK